MGSGKAGTVRRILADEAEKPYCFGGSDCFIIALRVIDALRGTHFTDRHYGTYSTFGGAQRELARHGYKSLVGFFDDRLERIDTLRCEPGDVAVVHDGQFEHTAICVGRQFVAKTKDGRGVFSADAVLAAYRV